MRLISPACLNNYLFRTLTAFLFLILEFQRISADEWLYLQLIDLEVIASGNICDLLPTGKECDMYLRICLSNVGAQSQCDVLFTSTPRTAFNNLNYIKFEMDIKGIANPIITRLEEFPDSIDILVDVFDADHIALAPDQHLASLKHMAYTIPSRPSDALLTKLNKSIIDLFDPKTLVMSMNVHGGHVRLRMKLWIQCADNFYGPRCETSCIPEYSQTGKHFGCLLADGSRVCMPGWRGDQCDEVDICETKHPCGPTGICRQVNSAFMCLCPKHFEDQFCIEPKKPCGAGGPLSAGTAADPYCKNGGVCVIDDDGTRQCICIPKFTGKRCEFDVDECSHWYSLQKSRETTGMNEAQTDVVHCHTPGHVANPCCGETAVCVNKFSGYQCMCPPGWTGLHCEFPPTLWPPGFQPQVNKSVEFGFLESPIWNTNFRPGSLSIDEEKPAEAHWSTVAFGVLLFILILILIVGFIIVAVYWRRRKPTELLPMRPLPEPYRHQPTRYCKPNEVEPGKGFVANALYTQDLHRSYPTLSRTINRETLLSNPANHSVRDSAYEQVSERQSEYETLLNSGEYDINKQECEDTEKRTTLPTNGIGNSKDERLMSPS